MKQTTKRFLSILLAFAMISGLLPGMIFSVQAADSTWNYGTTREMDDYNGYKMIQGVYYYPSAVPLGQAEMDLPATFFYSDGFFAQDACKYNNSLATTSLNMAMAAFYSNGGEKGKDADYSAKGDSIGQFLTDIGCDRTKIYANNYNKIRPQTDSIGVTMGQKKQRLADGRETGRILVPIAIRGSNYEKEWASNVTLGLAGENEGEAKGFSSAAQEVFRELQDYIRNYGLTEAVSEGKVDFWIAGYSRAGATTNLTAKRIVDTYVANQNNKVFAYCIEAPQGGYAAAEKSGSDYSCIHNVINKTDLVPRVAPGFMGFKRYGVDHYIPGTDAGTASGSADNKEYPVGDIISSPLYSVNKNIMVSQLKAVNGFIAFSDSFQVYGLDTRELKAGLATLLTPATTLGMGLYSYIKGKDLIIRKGKAKSMDEFLNEFFYNLQTFTGLTRERYVNGEFNKGNLQEAARDYMAVVFDSTPQEMENFTKALQKMWDDQVGILDLVGIFNNAFGKWGKLSAKDQNYYINKMIKWLNASKVYETLNLTSQEKDRLLNKDLPVIVDFLMTYLSADYNYELYGTNGMTQLFTFLGNTENIMSNHYPEVNLAWLRAQDPLYANETQAIGLDSVQVDTPQVGLYLNDKLIEPDSSEPIELQEKDLLNDKILEIRASGSALYGSSIRFGFRSADGKTIYRDDGGMPDNIQRIVSLNGPGEYSLVIDVSTVCKRKGINTQSTRVYPLKVTKEGAVSITKYDDTEKKSVTEEKKNTGEPIPLITDEPEGREFDRWIIKRKLNTPFPPFVENSSKTYYTSYSIRERNAALAPGDEWNAGDEITATAEFIDKTVSEPVENNIILNASEGESPDEGIAGTDDTVTAGAVLEDEYAIEKEKAADSSLTSGSQEVVSVNIEMAAPVTGNPLTNKVDSCTLTMSDGSAYTISPENVVVSWDDEAELWDDESESVYYDDALAETKYNATLSFADAALRADSMNGDTLIRINGETAELNYPFDLLDEAHEVVAGGGNISVSFPETETEKVELLGIEEPDELILEHGAELEAELPGTLLTYYSDGSETETAVTWYPADAMWFRSEDWESIEEYDRNDPEPVWGRIPGKAGDEEVFIYVYIAGLPETAMPEASYVATTYTQPISVELTAEDGARIFYTIDGTDPKTSETAEFYEKPIELGNTEKDVTLLAYAETPDSTKYDDSDVCVWNYIFIEPNLNKYTVELSKSRYGYNGQAKYPGVTVKDGSDVLENGTDYSISYENNVNAGKATAIITGQGYYTGTVNKTFTIDKASITETGSVKLSNSKYTYNGKAKKPGVTVTYGTTKLKDGTDYSITYKNNTNAGTASVIIRGKGNYTGKITKTFQITPAKNTLTVKAKKPSLKASKLKKKAQSIARKNAMTVSKAQGKVTYKLASVSKSKFKKYFSVNANNGKIAAKKGLAKGTYKLKIKVTAAGNKNYKKRTKNANVTIKVK